MGMKKIVNLLMIVWLSLPLSVRAEVEPRRLSPIPTNSYRSAEEEEYKKVVVSQALEDYLRKREAPVEGKIEQTSQKIEIIYPPPRDSEKSPESKREVIVRPKEKATIQVEPEVLQPVKSRVKELMPPGKGGEFELVVGGKKYRTLKEYKLDKIKNLLSESFFEANICMDNYTDEELLSVISEIRTNQSRKENDGLTEMKKMMDIYNKKKKEDQLLSVDLKNMKTIIIPSK